MGARPHTSPDLSHERRAVLQEISPNADDSTDGQGGLWSGASRRCNPPRFPCPHQNIGLVDVKLLNHLLVLFLVLQFRGQHLFGLTSRFSTSTGNSG